MMEAIYTWIRNLTGYFLFLAVIEALLPNRKYSRYVRLFSGMVLILLVLQPLTGSLRVDERIAHNYEAFVFRYQADDLKQEILGVEKDRLDQMITRYEEAVARDVGQMAADMGFAVAACSVEINAEEGTEQFGTVRQVRMTVSPGEDGDGSDTEAAGTGEGKGAAASEPTTVIKPVEVVEPVKVGREEGVGEAGRAGGSGKLRRESGTEVGKLRRKIASYYSLEEEYVEIQVMEGQG